MHPKLAEWSAGQGEIARGQEIPGHREDWTWPGSLPDPGSSRNRQDSAQWPSGAAVNVDARARGKPLFLGWSTYKEASPPQRRHKGFSDPKAWAPTHPARRAAASTH